MFQDSARQRDSEPRRIHSIDEQILEAGDERSEYIVKGIEELKVSQEHPLFCAVIVPQGRVWLIVFYPNYIELGLGLWIYARIHPGIFGQCGYRPAGKSLSYFRIVLAGNANMFITIRIVLSHSSMPLSPL